MSSLEQFHVFKEVADTGNITMASKRLHISQPSVSVQIQNLEKEYGAELFNRTNRGVTLTEPGKILYRKVTEILRAIDQAKEDIHDYCSHQTALIHVGATLTIGEYLLPRIMGFAMHDENMPRVSAHIANTSVIANELTDGKLSVGLIEGPIAKEKDIALTQFWSDELVVVVPYSHPWAERLEVTFDELTSEPYITREKGSGTRHVAELSLAEGGFDADRLNIFMELSSTKAIKETVAAGLGFSILSALTVQEECRQKRLTMLRLQGCVLERPLNLIVNSSRVLLPEEQQFVDLVCNKALLSSILPPPFLPEQAHSVQGTPRADGRDVSIKDAHDDDSAIMLPYLPLEDAIPNWDDLSKQERIICAILQEDQSQNSAAFAEHFGMSQRDVLQLLNNLIDKGIIEAFGGSKNRRYRFTDAILGD